MKFLKLSIVTAVAAFVACSSYAAGTAANLATQPYTTYSVAATNNFTATAWATIGANSANGGTPRLTFLSAFSDTNSTLAANTKGGVLFYKIIDQTQANYTNTTTSVPVAATNSFISGDLILIRHKSNDTYERLIMTTAGSATNLTLTTTPAQTVAIGDLIYKLGTNGAAFIPFCGFSNALAGTGIVMGQKGLPLHMAISGAANADIFGASAVFDP